MSDFELFNKALKEYNETEKSDSNDSKNNKCTPCLHLNVTDEKGVIECIDCGEEISKKIQHTKKL